MDPVARGYEDFHGRVTEFASESEPWWPARTSDSAHRPNIVVVLVDDLGFSDLGPFGGEIDTPNIDVLARDGWVFTNFHTAPMCSPSRAALLTGLNPHRAGFGYVAHVDPGYPGFACELPADAPTLAESLRASGYATFMVGKWHLTGESKLHDGAEVSSWPLQRGFDRYFGSMDGFTSLHHPHRLVDGNSTVDREGYPEGYFLTDELTDRAIGMLQDLRANDAEKPFFLYYAHTSVHGPIQAKSVDIEKYRGNYDAGWDRLRAERFARQRATGVVGPDTALPGDDLPETANVPRWDELSAADRELFARHMEVYAAAVDEVDQSIGRIVDHLTAIGEAERTIIVVTSDNGGTAEGGVTGTRSYFSQFGIDVPLPDGWVRDVPRDVDLIGGPRLFSQYPAGWARVSNTPFRAFKSTTYEGGVHAPLIVSWPAARGHADAGLRHQFVFVSDLAPTLLELAEVEPLAQRDGRTAAEIDGQSFAAAIADPDAPSRTTQYFECGGVRALVDGALKAVAPGVPSAAEGASGGAWELYDLHADPTETRDLAAERPDELRRLTERWRVEAWRNTVFPLDDDGTLQTVRPESELHLSHPVELTPFRPALERYRSARLTVLRSFAIDAELETTALTRGVIVAHGDQGGGYSLELDEGRLRLVYNAYGEMHRVDSEPIAGGPIGVRVAFDELPELRWAITVSTQGRTIARIPSVPMLLGMAPFTGISVGYDFGGPVDWERWEREGVFRFSAGEIVSLRYLPGQRSPYDPMTIRAIGEAVARVAD